MSIRSLIIFLFFSFSHLCYSMNQSKNNTLDCNSTDAINISSNNKTIAWEIIFYNCIDYFQNDDIDTLKQIGKFFKPLLIQTAPMRKKYINNHYPELTHKRSNQIAGFWNIYGSYYICISINDYRDNTLNTNNYELHSSWFGIEKKNTISFDFTDYVPFHTKPFVHTNGDICFYAYLDYNKTPALSLLHRNNSPEIIQITCYPGSIKLQECYLDYSSSGKLLNLATLINFPFLLKTLLDSAKSWNTKYGSMRIFSLEGLFLPENYKKFQQYSQKTCSIDCEQQSRKFDLFKLLREKSYTK